MAHARIWHDGALGPAAPAGKRQNPIEDPMTVPAEPESPVQSMLNQAARAMDGRNPGRASELAAKVLQLEPDHAGAHHLLGLALLDLHQLGRALEHLNRALALHPRSCEYATHFARALARANRLGEALQVANIAYALPPAHPLTLNTLGTVYMQCNAFERANALFRRAAAQLPEHAACRFNHAVTLTFTGDIEAAETEFDACLARQPTYWPAYGLRARLRRQTHARNHVEAMLALLAEHAGDTEALVQLHCALGKEYEDLGDYAQAFEHLRRGKAAARARSHYDPSHDAALVDAFIRAFPEPRPQPQGYGSDEPIFIVGMPRSGTTLVERIISSHPDVYSAGELRNFGMQVLRLSNTHAPTMLSPAAIDRAHRLDWERLGLLYVDSTRPQTANKPHFIDKLPHNFLYIGFIANALPNARIICLRRNPMDTCLSNFRELFLESSSFHGYSFDLLDIGRFYIQFDRMMTHWRKVLPGRVLEIDYEALVAEQEAYSRQLLAHCGLPWNDACLRFEQNTAASATASTTQVRQPIYAGAINRWEKYGELLEPLEQLLNEAGIATRG
jgi:tetratricopeptide (TPR) repeat protein